MRKHIIQITCLMLFMLMGGGLLLGSYLPLSASPAAQGTPVTSAFTFQGQLKKTDGMAVNNTCTFTFGLWDAAEAGAPVATEKPVADVPVVNGFFTVELDFGNQFTGAARWIAVRALCDGDVTETRMEKRILLTSSPYASGLMPGAVMNAVGELGLMVNAAGNALVGIGTKDTFAAVYGEDQSATGGYGIFGTSAKGPGVYGVSTEDAGVRGISSGRFKAGVVGIHNEKGYGVYGTSKGTGVYGVSEEWVGVFGQSTSYVGVQGESATNTGVYGVSEKWFGVYGVSEEHDAIRGVTKGPGKAGIVGVSEAGGIGVFGVGKNGGTGVYGRSEGDNFAVYADGKMGGKEVHILGGADLAEWVQVSEPVEPGVVVVIDAASPGMLKPSSTPYDAKVAGIVSGAGGVQPGLTLQQEGVLDGNTQVAIAGRVYVYATAADGAIAPGDLLTTSSVPGHAMKATDRDRSYGAVIGKAMTALHSGEGLVLVLVNLQ